MTAGEKRKGVPAGARNSQTKKKKACLRLKTGNSGKWKTAHQEAKTGSSHESYPKPGDAGIWVSCARGQEHRAAREVGILFDEFAEVVYGIKPIDEAAGDDGAGDIEDAIKREVAAMKDQTGTPNERIFKPVRMDVECLLFVLTQSPIQPVEFVRRICADAKSPNSATKVKTRYVNRLTPVSASGKATAEGLIDLARSVLAPFFDLSGKKAQAKLEPSTDEISPGSRGEKQESSGDAKPASSSSQGQEHSKSEQTPSFSFAIRPTIRNHNTLTREVVINQVAGLINNERHNVNLESPDKTILVNIYRNVCCMSVVGRDWDELKRFNLTELYSLALGGSAT
ncbi:hypothetical protein GQ53DRAFT_827646 [Thozetella sp. PMI_491]|nr:hypothetical protein GQ53DRAFT_827646 [Thozetella sp. PMI_491]